MPDVLAIKLKSGDFRLFPEYLRQTENLREGDIYKLKITKSRRPESHRRFFALLQALWALESIQDRFGSFEELRANLTIEAGHCYVYHQTLTAGGEQVKVQTKVPKSINWDSMDETEFKDFYNRAVNKVLQKWLPKYQPDDFERYVDQFVRF